MLDRFITIQNQTEQTVTTNDYKITPFSQVLRLKIPGVRGALTWKRPLSVLVQGGDGQETVLPVADLTRQAQWTLLGVSIAFPLLLWLLIGRRKTS